jgi:polar amino acid transport system permease protein
VSTGVGQTVPAGTERAEQPPIKAVPVRHPGRWIATALVLIFTVVLLIAVSTSKNFEWGVVRQFFTASAILHGLLVTLELTVMAMVIGIVLGVVLAVMRLSPVPVVSGASWVYIWFFRGTPVLVQIIFWYYVSALTGPHPAVGIPLTHVAFFHVNMNSLITPFTAATLALGLNEGAYMAEIVRAGILSVDEGQAEAAQSIGMSRLQTMRLIVLPQAMRVIVPPTGNETISMLKTSALASDIALLELLGTAKVIYSRTFQTIPLLLVASIWYLIVTSVLTGGQFYVERYFARGHSRALPPTPLQRLRALFTRNLTTFHGPPPPIPRADHR